MEDSVRPRYLCDPETLLHHAVMDLSEGERIKEAIFLRGIGMALNVEHAADALAKTCARDASALIWC